MLIQITLTIIVVFIITTLFGYLTHRVLHQPFMGKFYKMHLTHHFKLYPANNFFSETYLDPGKDNTAKFFFLIGLPLVVLPIILFAFHIISLIVFITAMISLALFGWLHDYLHDAFHITNHWLRKFTWFQKFTDIHFQHHINVQSNFGIYWFGWDRLFKSFIGK